MLEHHLKWGILFLSGVLFKALKGHASICYNEKTKKKDEVQVVWSEEERKDFHLKSH